MSEVVELPLVSVAENRHLIVAPGVESTTFVTRDQASVKS
jgi:hypothetical protein